MSVLSSEDPEIQQLIRGNPLLSHATIIGSGNFCKVFRASKKTRVLKLTADRTHYEYLVDANSPKGIFKPLVYRDMGKIGRTGTDMDVYLVEVERLREIGFGSENEKVIHKLIDFEDKNDRLPVTRKEAPGLPRELLQFMKELNEFTNLGSAHYDLCRRNFMERRNGTLVFSDPVFDQETCDTYYWES